nr:MAG TPA: large terminase [Caudoviricetes sp.]
MSTVPLTKLQREYLLGCNHRWNVKTGATGSGKSFVDYAAVIPKRILAARGEGLLVLLGNTRGTLERNILEPMREIWSHSLVGQITSNNTVNLFGKRCYALGADNRKHVDRLRGATIEYVYGDEVTTWSEEVFEMLKSRLRCEHSRFDGTCNPDSPHHWFKRFLDSDADIFQQSYTIDDGCLPDKIVNELKKEYAGTVYYDRYIRGLWTVAEGLVYQMVADNPARFTLKGPTQGMDGRFFVSIDYGTINPCSMGLWCVQGRRAIRVKESYYDSRKANRQRTDEEHYAALEELTRGYYIRYVVVDPSAASFIECIRRHGKYQVRHAENDVINGIRVTADLLNSGKVMIHEGCKDALMEFRTYRWDEKASEDKPIKDKDHAMDDIRYFCSTVLAREYRWADWRRADI